jgi:nickel/cobalt transporter (NiCoT) family protein
LRLAPRRVRALPPTERRTLAGVGAVVLGLHVLGFLTLLALAAPRHLAATGALSAGVGVTAYTLGLRHAFDADHISAIDSTTRKLMTQARRPVSVGFWFSLGHSTVVFALGALIGVGVRSLDSPVRNHGSTLHRVSGWVGPLVSGSFLYLIATLNVVILIGIVRALRSMRGGHRDEVAPEPRGPMTIVLARLMRMVTRPPQMYFVGMLFGLGFDTASEVALLVLAGGAARAGMPWYGIFTLPVLFVAGMTLMDSIDGVLMNYAFGWAGAKPVRKVFYNLTMTGLTVSVTLVVGTIELGGLLASQLGLAGAFWSWIETVNMNLLGYVVVGLCAAVWTGSAIVWRLGRIEERWSRPVAARAGGVRAEV